MKEGDSPSFLGLIVNGLNVPEKPEWGGWGGRYRLLNQRLFIDAPDFLNGQLNERHSVARWRTAFQRDFMARVKWATASFEAANHNPQVVVNGTPGIKYIDISAQPGEKITLDASESIDPDGDGLVFSWFVYEEIYKPERPLVLEMEKNGAVASFALPQMPGGAQIHLILEVSDSGSPSLSSYRRILLTAK